MTRTYSELIQLQTFRERFEYLRLGGSVGAATFGGGRYLNQLFYKSDGWHQVRNFVILRDRGNDLGVVGHEIKTKLLVHHMQPITERDIRDRNEWIMNPEFLITTCHDTHNAIHYGDESLLPQPVVQRTPGDTKLW